MTSRALEASLNNPTGSSPRACAGRSVWARTAFSLVEMMVVIGVIVILAGITISAILKAKGSADKARLKADLLAIASALDHYANDFKGVYPMADPDPRTGRATGLRVLAKALIGPGPAADRRNPQIQDGFDGPGFRTMPGGRIYQPYLAADKFKTVLIGTDWELLDSAGNPVAYLPKRNTAVRPDIGPIWLPPKESGKPMYDPMDFTNDAALAALIAAALGDHDGDRRIRGGETLRHSGPYILISAGTDGVFGPAPGNKPPDDIYNFER